MQVRLSKDNMRSLTVISPALFLLLASIVFSAGVKETPSTGLKSGDVKTDRSEPVKTGGQSETRTDLNRLLESFQLALYSQNFFFFPGAEEQEFRNHITRTFSGERYTLYDKGFSDTLSLTSTEQVSLSSIRIQPGLGFSVIWPASLRGNLEAGLMAVGLIPYTTADQTSNFTLKEHCTNPVAAQCHLSNSGFVDAATRQGSYQMTLVASEEYLHVLPHLIYEYRFLSGNWWDLQAGIGAGVFFMSHRQRIQFSAIRSDNSTTVVKVLEGDITSTSVNDPGPLVMFHLGWNFRLLGLSYRLRVGGSWGQVKMNRQNTGYFSTVIGKIESSKSPISEIGYPESETINYTAASAFLQFGLLF